MDTDTISKADKKRANIIDMTTMNCFFGDSCADWSVMETNLRSRAPDGGEADSSRTLVGTADEGIETGEVPSVDEGDDIVEWDVGRVVVLADDDGKRKSVDLVFIIFGSIGTRFAEAARCGHCGIALWGNRCPKNL